mmetsp:Transcript_133/g.169  ORF Transcript_133/g.169 Transcript_133/m.169 type:complete len:165 (+) Transcript_133:209-703(+)|eukprot:CAMPEP_0198138374 /NCGR_PEP_ID=MMETSP1443-20131203/1791_1 /TAXON_ID=186043 /ORGANISM="Entomoneis sp., Strain CCMP2396" /LENGTH=164 /DNA_ID=CAMNT_0043800125 /DNA_START=134 /DNA_END=628 /DNA_ORIENTATION=+
MSLLNAKEVRYQWWSVTVILFNVIVPLVVSVGTLVAPNAILLDGYTLRIKGKGGDDIDTINVNEVFRDVARTMACGTLLMAFLAHAAATTSKVHVLFFTSALIVIYYTAVCLVMIIQWGVEGFLDIFTLSLDLVTILLHAFILIRIRVKTETSESQDEHIRLIV